MNEARRNNFDPLRLLFALCVLAGHSYRLTASDTDATTGVGSHGVDLAGLTKPGLIGFFAISGYLVCGSYLSSRSAGSYLWKRLLRICPAFLAVALLSVLVVGPAGSDGTRAYFHDLDLTAQARAIATLHVPRTIAHAFPHNRNHQVNAPTWSLPVEFALYLLVALLGVTTLLRRRWPVAVAWVALACLHVFIARYDPPWANVSRFAQGTMHTFVPLYLVFVGGALIKLHPSLRSTALVTVLAILCVLAHRCRVGNVSDYLVAPAMVIWIGEHPVRLPRLGDDLSYGMYLNAWPIQQLLVAFLPLGPMLLTAFAIAISAPLATLSWRFVERPALRLKGVDLGRVFFSSRRRPSPLS